MRPVGSAKPLRDSPSRASHSIQSALREPMELVRQLALSTMPQYIRQVFLDGSQLLYARQTGIGIFGVDSSWRDTGQSVYQVYTLDLFLSIPSAAGAVQSW